jgi:hypothetical protein
LFLSKAERDYLLEKDQASHDYVCVKSRLNKKMKVFVDQELPLLLSKGYLTDIAEFRNIAENCKVEDDGLVRIPPQTGLGIIANERIKRSKWAGRDLNPRSPPCQGGILTRLDHRPDIQ